MRLWSRRPRFGLVSALLTIALYPCSLAFGQIIPGKYTLILQDPPVSRPLFVQDRPGERSRRGLSSADRSAPGEHQAGSGLPEHHGYRLRFGTAECDLRGRPRQPCFRTGSVPGVAQVLPMHRFRRKLDQATQVLNGPAAWNALGGLSNAGLGIKIGVVDTGIDQTAPVFQDSSLPMPAGFPKMRHAVQLHQFHHQ